MLATDPRAWRQRLAKMHLLNNYRLVSLEPCVSDALPGGLTFAFEDS